MNSIVIPLEQGLRLVLQTKSSCRQHSIVIPLEQGLRQLAKDASAPELCLFYRYSIRTRIKTR